jgi:hypothetical protein
VQTMFRAHVFAPLRVSPMPVSQPAKPTRDRCPRLKDGVSIAPGIESPLQRATERIEVLSPAQAGLRKWGAMKTPV